MGSDYVFVDSSGWIASLNSDDRHHHRALEWIESFYRLRRQLVTTDWVFAETGNGLSRSNARAGFAAAVRQFIKSPHFVYVKIDDSLCDQSLALYEQIQDKPWGLVDCASFVVMRRYGIVDALTVDRHFVQAGFRALLRAD